MLPVCATNLLTFAMDMNETDSALEEAGAETDLDTDKECELLRLIKTQSEAAC